MFDNFIKICSVYYYIIVLYKLIIYIPHIVFIWFYVIMT